LLSFQLLLLMENKMDLPDVCIICGETSDEVDMIETEDGWICVNCSDEQEEETNEESEGGVNEYGNGLKII